MILYRKPETNVSWNHWFAWHPIWIGQELVWLETVWRRLKPGITPYGNDASSWEYDKR